MFKGLQAMADDRTTTTTTTRKTDKEMGEGEERELRREGR